TASPDVDDGGRPLVPQSDPRADERGLAPRRRQAGRAPPRRDLPAPRERGSRRRLRRVRRESLRQVVRHRAVRLPDHRVPSRDDLDREARVRVREADRARRRVVHAAHAGNGGRTRRARVREVRGDGHGRRDLREKLEDVWKLLRRLRVRAHRARVRQGQTGVAARGDSGDARAREEVRDAEEERLGRRRRRQR
ncbi:uncharacterized protein MICPUCDRAFT_48490, partial [Micromonas pusilla CCMP1545]